MPAIRTDAIQTKDLSFGYNGRRVLNFVSFNVKVGECVAVLGANGAGKTTLLKLVSGVLTPCEGSITINGHAIKRTSDVNLARTLAFVPQEFSVSFEFTVQEIVELGRTAYLRTFGGLARADRLAVERAMRLTDIAGLRHCIFNDLSGGERRRVVLAMALAQEPQILLLDEPTQQLDVGRQADILDVVTALSRDSGLTILAAIHDLNLAARYFKRLVLLDRGRIVASGTPTSVLHPRLLQEVYGKTVEVFRENDNFPIVLPKLFR